MYKQVTLMTAMASALISSSCGKAGVVDQRCQAASAILKTAFNTNSGEKVILTTNVEQAPLLGHNRTWTSFNGSEIQPPSPNLIQRLIKSEVISAIGHCNFKHELADKDFESGPAAVDKAMDDFSKQSSIKKKVIISISLPVISADGKSALAYYYEVSGLTAGGSYTYYLKKNSHRRWIIVGSLVGAVS